VSLSRSSRAKLTPRTADLFPGETLFARVARAICSADCLPRKELYESWEVARRTRRRFRGGRIVDLAAGHALVAHLLVLLDDTSEVAIAVDARIPQSAGKIARAMAEAWPRLRGRVMLEERTLESIELGHEDLVVSTHACGALTDRILARAVAASARVAVLPCCHEKATCDAGGLEGWMDAPLAIDATRAAWLRSRGYDVWTQCIPEAITPKNRLLLASPSRRP
jgi:hypothetical protein